MAGRNAGLRGDRLPGVLHPNRTDSAKEEAARRAEG